MKQKIAQISGFQKRKNRVRFRVKRQLELQTDRVRLCVARSSKHISAQMIDSAGKVLACAASDEKLVKQLKTAEFTKTKQAEKVGQLIAERAVKAGLLECVFDRGGNRYHGRIKALADAARQGGLSF